MSLLFGAGSACGRGFWPFALARVASRWTGGGAPGCVTGAGATAGGGGAMSRSNFLGALVSALERAFNSRPPPGPRDENGFTPVGAWAPGAKGLPTAASLTTGLATGLPVLSISTTFCVNGCGFGGGTRRATIGRSGLGRGIALDPAFRPGDTTRLPRVGATPTAVSPITGACSICARGTRIGRTVSVANVL
jgi:hypothetical protein